jgi:hypothetical protein
LVKKTQGILGIKASTHSIEVENKEDVKIDLADLDDNT